MKLKKLMWTVFGRHNWHYHNPYDRTCNICGKHEVMHCLSFDSPSSSWWEVFNDGDEAKHYPENK